MYKLKADILTLRSLWIPAQKLVHFRQVSSSTTEGKRRARSEFDPDWSFDFLPCPNFPNQTLSSSIC